MSYQAHPLLPDQVDRKTPTLDTLYAIGLCGGKATLPISRCLFGEAGIHCWTPVVIRKNPRKGQKAVVAALPGVLFIPEDEWQAAQETTKSRGMSFSRLMFAAKNRSVSGHELAEFKEALTNTELDTQVIGDLQPGDDVVVKHGPLKGLVATLSEVYIRDTLMCKLTATDETRDRAIYTVSLPVSFITRQ